MPARRAPGDEVNAYVWRYPACQGASATWAARSASSSSQPSELPDRQPSLANPDSRSRRIVPPPGPGSSSNSTRVDGPVSTATPASRAHRHAIARPGSTRSTRARNRPCPSHSNQTSAPASGRKDVRSPNHPEISSGSVMARQTRSGAARSSIFRSMAGAVAVVVIRRPPRGGAAMRPSVHPRTRRTVEASRRGPSAVRRPARGSVRGRPSAPGRVPPARSASRCFVTPWRVIGRPEPTSVIELAPCARSRSRMTRRVGSATAARMASTSRRICNRIVACQVASRALLDRSDGPSDTEVDA